MNGDRVLLGGNATFASRERVWQTSEGFEIDSNIHYEIARRRVLFEDVLMVTLHHTATPAYLAVTAIFGIFFMALGGAIIALVTDAWPASIPLFMIGLPALIAFFIRLVYGLDIITIFGRRSKATIRFGMRKSRVREVYGQICAAVRAAQRSGVIPEE